MRRAQRTQGGFTLIEILVALLVTVVGLAGVMMMQAETVRSNRRAQQFTRAANLAEEIMEVSRGTRVDLLLDGVTYDPQEIGGTTYAIALQAAEVATGSNLVRVIVTVTYSEDNDSSSADDRVARVEMLRTKTEAL
jgi:type IV pilus modification protein PilV